MNPEGETIETQDDPEEIIPSDNEVLEPSEPVEPSEPIAEPSEPIIETEPIVMDDTNEILMNIFDTLQYVVSFQVVIMSILLIALFFIAVKAGKSQ